MSETIAAIATAAGGALSVIRVSGDTAVACVNRIFSKDLSEAKGYTVHYGEIREQEEPVDEVLVTVFRAPKSYTGEDLVEISGHGGSFVTRKVLSLVLGSGARMARRGEFT
jgi:tRNA modification GTPase